ncbi:threonine ammonia-lyase, biosynthetic [bacterium]|jgi:threonine dehydratase|nr:threonine ammonia-lyase, biosynthetic [bacterium]
MLNKIVEKILRSYVYEIITETPLQKLSLASSHTNNTVYLKREDLQPVFSFKIRGAYNKISSILKTKKIEEVVTASAGNHAQGVALSAKTLNLKATIIMPKTTPSIKVSAVKELGSTVILHGDSYDESFEFASNYAKTKNITFIHPYDDEEVIAGQGTIGMEIMRQKKEKIDAVFIPVGGGGLIAGISAYLKFVDPSIKIIGVEPEDSPALYNSLKSGKREILEHVGIFADGVAVKQIGKEPYKIITQTVDDVILVTTDEICASIKDIFDDTRSIAEPSGALALAGLKKYAHSKKNQTYVAINSGANINFDRLRHVSERTEIGENKEALFAVTIPEKAGSFNKFCKSLGNRSITEFNYRYSDSENAHIFVGIELTNGPSERAELIKLFDSLNFKAQDLSDNELAKIHIRHMVGGKTSNLTDEQIYRFQFPERPGALLTFLKKLGDNWNISLFHYRNHGAAYGRVLAGIQVPNIDSERFDIFLKSTGFFTKNESKNPAYQLFL